MSPERVQKYLARQNFLLAGCVISVILRRVYFRHKEKQQILFIKKRGTNTMIINAILLTIGLVGIPAAICAKTELTCGAAA